MKRFANKGMLTFILVFLSLISTAQNKEMSVTYLGNCGFLLSCDSLHVCIDFPYKSGSYGYMTFPSSTLDSIPDHSIYLFTHGHADHYDKTLFKGKNAKLYAPWPVRWFVSGKRKYSLKTLNHLSADFFVTQYRTKHRLSLKHYSYLIEWNGKRIFISGDATSADVISQIKNLDLVIAPTWLLHDASGKNISIDTKKVILSHLRSEEKVTNQNPEKIIVPLQHQTFILP